MYDTIQHQNGRRRSENGFTCCRCVPLLLLVEGERRACVGASCIYTTQKLLLPEAFDICLRRTIKKTHTILIEMCMHGSHDGVR
jgi:hypothetical protein